MPVIKAIFCFISFAFIAKNLFNSIKASLLVLALKQPAKRNAHEPD
jgi:hypothetical protein